MRKWLRKSRVTFDGGFTVNPSATSTTTELKVEFSASRTISGSPNEFEVSITNLNSSNRNRIGKELKQIKLECGYDGSIGVIAQGFIRDVQHERNGPDIITTVTAGDGDKSNRQAAISKTFPKNTAVKDVVQGIYDEMAKFEVSKGEWKFPDDIRTLKRPYSICGACSRELNVLGRGNEFYWSIQNGVMEVIPSDGFLSGTTVISAQTGMIDSPTLTDNGIKVKTLLDPNIRPNRLVQVISETQEMNSAGDLFRVSQVDFSGCNNEGDFIAEVHGEAVNGSKVDEGVKTT